jgi:peroxin-2
MKGDEENRIFVPAQSDCWGGCRWCYYCIMGELAQNQAQDGSVNEKEGACKWDCLRCGGRVTKAWRVGPKAADQVVSEGEIEKQPI